MITKKSGNALVILIQKGKFPFSIIVLRPVREYK